MRRVFVIEIAYRPDQWMPTFTSAVKSAAEEQLALIARGPGIARLVEYVPEVTR
jgi:hypothetical protein